MGVMNLGLEIVLLLFALVGYIGTGASLAVARYRALDDGQIDVGMLGVALMLLIFGAICTAVAVGGYGILAVGGVATWASYVATARQIGLFAIDIATPSEPSPAPPSESRT
jgi:hypothetical protein